MNIMKKIISISCILLLIGCQNTKDENILTDNISNRVKISVQLWSVKDELKQDFKGTLKTIAKMGFDGVEFAGNYGPYKDDAAGLKVFLDDLGLKASGAHVHFGDFEGDKFQEAVDYFKVLEAKYLIIPMDNRAFENNTVDVFITDLIKFSERLKPHGLKTGYHNHWQEFEPYKETTFWDYIAQSTANDVVLQMDIGWVEYARKDPVEYVKRYPNRTLTSHYKARPMEGNYKNGLLPLIGQDGTDWISVINAQLKFGGTQWFVVEQEEYPNNLTPLEAVEASKQALDGIIASMSTK